jgi:hypothetical protein
VLPRLVMLLVTAAAVGLVVAGCGNSDDGDGNGSVSGSETNSQANVSVTTSSLTKAQFVEKATRVCEDERQTIPTRSEAYQRTAPKDQSATEAYEGGVRAVLLPTFQAEVDGITDLGAPKGEEKRVEAILTARQQAIDEVEELKSIKSIDDVTGHFAEANELMRKYGLTNCTIIAEP